MKNPLQTWLNKRAATKAAFQHAQEVEQKKNEEHQRELNCKLYNAVYFKKDVSVLSGLLEQGAQANAVIFKLKGSILAQAIEGDCPPSSILLLYKNGASFDDALTLMRTNGWKEESIQKLELSRQQVMGQLASKIGVEKPVTSKPPSP